MASLIQTILDRIVSVLSEHESNVLGSLRPPASREELTDLELLFGADLSSEVRDLYLWHNGADGVVEAFQLADDFVFISTLQAAAERTTMNHVISDILPNPADAARFWRPTWLPIGSSSAGSLLVVDHEPGDTYGTVFPFEHGNGARRDRGWPDLTATLNESLNSLTLGY